MFNQQKAWEVLEHFGIGRFEVVADYIYPDIDSFFNASMEFVPVSKWKKYKKALEEIHNT